VDYGVILGRSRHGNLGKRGLDICLNGY